jgi:hypothetical protein
MIQPMYIVAEAEVFQRHVAATWSEGERREFIDWINKPDDRTCC